MDINKHGIWVDDLQTKLQQLCNSPNLVQKYKYEAQDFICTKYNRDDVVARTLEVYRKER